MRRLAPTLALAAGLLAAGGAGEAQGPQGLAGDWTLATTPSISVIAPRGQPGKPAPLTLKLTSGRSPLAGTMTMWRGDVHRTDPVRGTFEAGKVVLTTANYTFTGTYDAARKVVAGSVKETPSGADPDGKPTTFRMTR